MDRYPQEIAPPERLTIARLAAEVATAAGIRPDTVLAGRSIELSPLDFDLSGRPADVWYGIVQALYAGRSGKAGFRADAVAALLEELTSHAPGNDQVIAVARSLASTPSPQGGSAGLFLSYAHTDRSALDQLLHEVRRRSPQTTVFVDHEMPPGVLWLDTIRHSAGRSAVMACWVTKAYLDSAFCNYEIGLAQAQGATTVPVVTDGALLARAPAYLSQCQAIMATSPPDFAAIAGPIIDAVTR